MTYAEAIQFLYSLQLFGAQFGLERAHRLAELAGHPQSKLRFIHVAGTNGKGSTCAMLEAIYRAAGLRVGLYTSPHLVSFRERIQINRELIPEDDVAALVAGMRPWLNGFAQDNHPTFFEFVTIMALRHFAVNECDVVIWETGLGGRLDATNIVTPLASVITNIQFDHEKWLGNTLEQIASEKAGIIKAHIPVVTGEQEPSALRVIRDQAKQQAAPLYMAQDPSPATAVVLKGEHQRRNAALVIKTVEVLRDTIPVSEEVVIEALRSVQWLGRFQIVRRGSQTLILDGAHNPDGAKALVETLHAHFGQTRFTFIVGVLADKNWQSVVSIFAHCAEEIICVPVASDRTALPGTLAQAAREANPDITTKAVGSAAEALSIAREGHVVVTGSLYLVGEVLDLLGEDPGRGERALNEWSARPR